MIKQPSYHFSLTPGGKRILMDEGNGSTSYLAFSERHQRFVAHKTFSPDPFRDELYRERLQDRLEEVQRGFTGGMAYPFAVGEEDQRFYQVTQILPGHSLREIVEWRGPLGPQEVFLVARRLIAQLRQLRSTIRLTPELSADSIMITRGAGLHWKLGFAEYDLRKVYGEGSATEEQDTFTDLALMLYYLGTGIQRKFLPTKTGDIESSRMRDHSPDLWRFYLQLFRFANAENACPLRYLEAMVDSCCSIVNAKLELGCPPPDREYLNWLPDNGEFPEPFDSRGRDLDRDGPFVFEAVDRLRETAARVHFLPPHSMTQSGAYESHFQQMRRVVTSTSPHMMEVDCVMVDPDGRLVAEHPAQGVPLSTILERRELFSRQEVITILSKVDEAITGLEADVPMGESIPSMSLNDIYLVPSEELPAGLVRNRFTWLADKEAFTVQLRPLRTNLFFEEMPDLVPLSCSKDASLAARAFEPDHSFTTLAMSLAGHALDCEEEAMDETVAEVFRRFYRQPASNDITHRHRLMSRLVVALGIKDEARQLLPQPITDRAKVGFAAASASASVFLLVSLCLMFFRS